MPWKRLSRAVVFDHPRKRVVAWRMRTHQGKEREFVISEGHDVVIIFPLTDDQRVVVIKQYYVALRRAIWSLVAGMVDPGYTPLQTARKELREEAGCTARRFVALGTAAKGKYATGKIHYYLALGAHNSEQQELEEAEDITVKFFPLARFKQMLRSGQMEEAWVELGARRALQYLEKRK